MDSFFIDKLNVTQNHNPHIRVTSVDHVTNGDQVSQTENREGYIPVIATHRYIRYDLATGERTEHFDDFNMEGSFSSFLKIKCDGFRVSVFGNPSRWGRVDNLFGLKTFDDCMAVYNKILIELGLPPFTKCTSFYFADAKKGKGTHKKIYNGALFTHIDFTRNHSVGEGNEQPFNKALSSHAINRSIPAYLYPNEHTVEWYSKNIQGNGSTFRYVKVYTKTADLLRNQKKHLKGASLEDHEYYHKLIDFTARLGVVREEHSFKRAYLERYEMQAYGLVKEEDFKQELQCITDIRKRLEVSKMEYETMAEQLIEEGICKSMQAANATQSAYLKWLHGSSFDRSKSQYRIYRKRLLSLGIDISQKLDISRAPLRLKSCEIIEVKSLEMPEWYRKPVIPQQPYLKLVA